MVGRRIGRFEIQAPLGKGGMGSVWRAEDTLLGRAVAIKILAEELAQDDESRRRFRREGEIAAQLDHPGICTVYEAGEQDGMAWLAMACIDGVTLSEKVRERLMPVAEVLRVGRMAADALAHAHARDVLHRDVTSRNIMLARDGRVVLLDLGLAIVSDASRITGPGAVVGTIAYMAPELLAGGHATPQSDLYGLGVVLYEALTGARPFHSENAEALRYRVLQESPEPVRVLRPEVPAALEAVVMKAMARAVEERFGSATEMLEALQACSRDAAAATVDPVIAAPPVRVAPSSRRKREPDSRADTAPLERGAANGLPRDLGARIAAGSQPVYLAVLAVEDAAPDEDSVRTRVLEDLVRTAEAALGDLENVRVVDVRRARTGMDARDVARAAGANLVLHSRARADGSILRITYALLDPETGTRLAGGRVDGSVLEPFRLEDRFVEFVSRSLCSARVAPPRATHGADPAAKDRFAQARSYLQRFDHEASVDGAIAILERLRTTEPPSAAVLAVLSRAYLARRALTQQREWEAHAATACERALELDASCPDVLLAQAELHLAAGHHQEALAAADRLLARADDYEGRLVRARALSALGRPDDAEIAAIGAIEAHPEDWRGHHTLGLVRYRVGRYLQAIEAWRRTTELCPDNAGAHRNLGGACVMADRMDEGVQAFRRSIGIRPNAMAYYNLGTALFFSRHYEESLEAFEQAVALNPSDPVTWGNLGNACRFIEGREERMREALARAVALGRERVSRDPTSVDDWARLAGWLSNLDEHGEAIEAVLRALRAGPDDVRSMITAAHVFLRAGDDGEALHWLRQAVDHGHGIEMLKSDPDLDVLRKDPRFNGILESGTRSRPATDASSKGRPS